MPDIFLSYNREDQAVARRFAEAFEGHGFEVWWDATLKSGEAYDEVTETALRTAKAVVVLWSPRSVVSRWVRAEATLADRNKTLVPCTIEPCDRPIMFELTQTAELSHWQGEPTDKAWVAFLGDVRRFLKRSVELVAVAPQPQPLAPSPAQSETKRGKRGEAPSLAVLPFANRSGLSEDDVFAFGMVEDIIDALSQNAALNVLASSATARFRTGAIPELAAVAHELDVRYVLEGNVRRVSDSLRVTAQLVEPATGRIVWTQRFDRPLSQLAALQEDLVVDVASQLDASVSRLEVERALRKPSDLTAWEAVMRAQAAYDEYTPQGLERIAELAGKAVEIDPNYGLAHGMLAVSLAGRYVFLTKDDPGEVARIRGHAERALQLERTNGLVLAYAARAFSMIGEQRLALAHAENAVRQSPNATLAAAALGEVLAHFNRTDEAVAAMDRACRFTMTNNYYFGAYGWKGIAFMRASRWAEAEVVEDELLALLPTLNFALMHKAILCHRDGRIAEARTFAQGAREVDPDISLEIWELRLSRWHANSPTWDVILDHLRLAWASTEKTA